MSSEFQNNFDGENPDDMNKKIRMYRKALRNSKADDNSLPSPEIIEDLVNYCIENEKYDEAYDFSALWIEYFPFSSEAWQKRGIAQLHLNMPKNSIKSLEKAISINPSDAESFINLSAASDTLGNHEKALEYIEEAIRIEPDNEDALFQYGLTLQNLFMYEKAEEVFKYLLQNEDFKQEALIELGFIASTIGNYQEAIHYNKLSIDEDPYDYNQWYNLGMLYFDNEQFIHAVEAFDMALAIKEDFVSALVYKAKSYAEAGKPAEAIIGFNEALLLVPDDTETMMQLAGVYADAGDYAQAIQLYTVLADRRPFNYEPYFNRGLCHDALEHYTKAIKDYDRALEFNTNVPELWHAKADALYNKGDIFDAIDCYKMVVELDPFNYSALLDLAEVYFEIEKFEYCIQTLDELVNISPKLFEANYLYSKVYALLGNYKKAASYLEKSIFLSKKKVDYKSDFLDLGIDYKEVEKFLTL